MIGLFITFVYQPFLNILVFLYWILDLVTGGNPDMGIAVIFLTLFIRILLFPMTLAGSRSEKERRDIAQQVKKIENEYSAEPVKKERAKKQLLKTNRRILVAELVSLSIQVTIALMLWKIFETGLPGEDLHLIYSFMPEVQQPFNLTFLGTYDLSHTSFTLNLVQSILIFVFEIVAAFNSPYPVKRSEVVRLQLVLPVVSFVIFMRLPAGKKLFVITSLCFSILWTIFKIVRRRFLNYKDKWESAGQGQPEETVVKDA